MSVRGAVKTMICVAAVAVLSGCGLSTGPDVDLEGAFVTTPVEVTIPFGGESLVEGTVLRMTFGAVLEDSRCPTDVTCVWEGNARVGVTIAAGSGPDFPLELNTSLQPRAREWNEVLVTLLELTPLPVSDQEIPDADYVVRLRLEPMP